MTTKEITVSISKKLSRDYNSDGVMASITISIEDGDLVGAIYRDAWLICQEEVDKQAGEIKTTNQIKDSVDKASEFKEEMNEERELEALCPVHHVPFVLRPAGISKSTGKGYPAFWACPEKNIDGSYCAQKPPKQ